MAVTQRKRNPVFHQEIKITRYNKTAMLFVALGITNVEAAEMLKISPSGFEQRIKTAMDKIGANGRANAVFLYLKHKYITPEEVDWLLGYLEGDHLRDTAYMSRKPEYLMLP